MKKAEKRKRRWAYYKLSLLYGISWFAMALMILFMISATAHRWFIGDKTTTLGLLTGYRNWYMGIGISVLVAITVSLILLILVVVDNGIKASDATYQEVDDENAIPVRLPYIRGALIFFLMLLAIGIFEFVIAKIVTTIKKKPKFSLFRLFSNHILISNLMFGMLCLFAVAFLQDVKPFTEGRMFQADIRAVKNEECDSASVYFSPRENGYNLVNMGGDYDEVTTSYAACGCLSDRTKFPSWTHFYFPEFMEFHLDTGHLYHEQYSIKWNEENTTIYQITYTPNRNVIVKYEKLTWQ